jgi:DNA-binding winged helix-turn-helix (wHTH) protein
MTDTAQVWFGPFRLDVREEVLWHEHERLALSPKALALLRYLVEHPGQLVSKAALLAAVWPETVVGDAVLTVGMAEVRKVLGDNPRAPRFVETVHRRGYRFIAPLRTTQPGISRLPAVVGEKPRTDAGPQREAGNWKRPPRLVGRDAELLRLCQCFRKALSGERQVVFVTGEAGSGKTALVETFLAALRHQAHHQGARSEGILALPPRSPPPRYGSGKGTARNSTARAKPISPSWTHWATFAGLRAARRSWRPCASMPPPGSYRCPLCGV